MRHAGLYGGCAPGSVGPGTGWQGAGPVLVALVGPAAAGKSTYARTVYGEGLTVSLDGLRGLVCGDPADQSATPAAVEVLHRVVGERLRRGQLVVVDAANLALAARLSLLHIADGVGLVDTEAVLFRVPLGLCRARNAARCRRLPEEVLGVQHQLAAEIHPDDLLGEGWRRVQTVVGWHAPRRAAAPTVQRGHRR